MKNTLPLLLLACKDLTKVAFFKEALKDSFSIVHTGDIQEAFEWLKSSPIEILILEKGALTASLKETCKAAQKITRGKNLPILFISNSIKKNDVLEALNAGVSDFIREPLTSLQIHERIAVCLNSRLVNKKVKFVKNKIKTAPFAPRNAKTLLDRTFIRDQTLKTISTAKKGAAPLSVLMIHLDSFAKLQDTLSKSALKEIFSALEALLKGRLRKYDTFVMEGPGQYLILLPKTSQSAAKVIAEDLRKEISRTTITTPTKEILVTVSIGVVSFEKEPSKSAKDFEQFDLCLERVKKSLIRSQKKGTIIVT